MYTGVVMNSRLTRRRALRGIERDLAASDPRPDELFLLFTRLASPLLRVVLFSFEEVHVVA
jgi:hypothetical protein